MIGVALFISKFKTFKQIAAVVSLSEAISLAIYLLVMPLYGNFNYLIQAMGIIAFVLIIFLIPNRTSYVIVLSVLGPISFFICAGATASVIDRNEFWASVVYILLAIILCAVFAANTQRHQYREYITKSKLEHLSSTDFLTGTANRFRLEEEAIRWMEFCRRQDMPLSLVFIDVDNLKRINDRYGHAAGDSVLVSLAQTFQRQMRGSDTLARWGGDEFVLLLPNTSLENAASFMKRIKLTMPEHEKTMNIPITWSCGIVQMRPGAGFHTLLSEADALMYEGKHTGKDSICSADGLIHPTADTGNGNATM
jgi:diguanylate cyclase (GGDEF)-like protein